jgi:hypothetical protein
MVRIVFFFLVLFHTFSAFPVLAKAETPLEVLQSQEQTILANATDDQKMQFQKIRVAHGTLRAVRDVRDSLTRAVKNCTAVTPDLKSDLDASLKAWKKSVAPVIMRGQKQLDQMIVAQKFTTPIKMKAYLKQFDTVVDQSSQVEAEVPIKDKDACRAMQKNMDVSAKTMAGLMIETLGLDGPPAAKTNRDTQKPSIPTE